MKQCTLTYVIISILAVAVIVMILHQKRKEGFQDKTKDVYDALNPDEFAFNLVQAVKGPIKRLSSTLLDIPTWKERFTLAAMNPVELARHQLRKQIPK